MYVFACLVHMCMCTHVLMQGPEVDKAYLFQSMPTLSTVVASISLELTDLATVNGQFAQGILLLPPKK